MMIEKGSKMAKKVDYTAIRETLKGFTDAALAKYDSHSYACGYFEALIVSMVDELPAHKQREILSQLERSTATLS